MKVIRNTLHSFGHGKEKEPRDKKANRELNQLRDPTQSAASRQLVSRHLRETGDTEHTIVVLGNALTAEIPRTARTARGRFPYDVIKTALVSQIGHV
jgi:hypothetical protein